MPKNDVLILAKRRVGRRRRQLVSSSPAPVAGPVLVAASYDAPSFVLSLTFDRAVNLTGGFLAAETITVLDGPGEAEILNAPDAEGAGTTTLAILMFANAAWTGEGVTMSAGGATGIVSDDDAEPWTGAMNVELPYP